MPRQILTLTDATVATLTGSTDSAEFILCNDASVRSCDGYTAFLSITKADETAKTFTAAATDICSTADHGWATGRKGQVSTDTTLPAGLLAVTDYFVVNLTDGTFKLATSYANAIATPPVVQDITDTGTGVHTFTPTALAGASWQIKTSPDDTGELWFDLAAATNITATVKSKTLVEKPRDKRIKISYLITAGQLAISQKIVADLVVQSPISNT